MQTKFTKGPWLAEEGDKFDMECVITTEKRKQDSMAPICQLDVVFTDPLGEEQIANSHLIAAAPEMYLALSYALAALKELNILEATQELIIEAQRKALGV